MPEMSDIVVVLDEGKTLDLLDNEGVMYPEVMNDNAFWRSWQ